MVEVTGIKLHHFIWYFYSRVGGTYHSYLTSKKPYPLNPKESDLFHLLLIGTKHPKRPRFQRAVSSSPQLHTIQCIPGDNTSLAFLFIFLRKANTGGMIKSLGIFPSVFYLANHNLFFAVAAWKVGRILCSDIPGLHEFDCMQHLQNVWIGSTMKALTSELSNILHVSLEEIDPRIRVSSSISAVICKVDKDFSLSSNYPKGHVDLFGKWMLQRYPCALLLHVERASGSRQDLWTEGCLPIIMNYPYYLEFLDWMLKKTGKNKNASLLQRNLFVVFGSVEMIALSRLLSIVYIFVCIPFHWLLGKTHRLKEYNNWGPPSMAPVIDTLREKMNAISKKPELILNEQFMIGIFK